MNMNAVAMAQVNSIAVLRPLRPAKNMLNSMMALPGALFLLQQWGGDTP
jgi:hypothetical protein